jgi:hypothetical protein
MQLDPQRFRPALQVKLQLVPLQVATPPAGAGQGEQRVPQVRVE